MISLAKVEKRRSKSTEKVILVKLPRHAGKKNVPKQKRNNRMNTNTQEEIDDVCENCGGEGVVMSDAPVYSGEPHMASIKEAPCHCKIIY